MHEDELVIIDTTVSTIIESIEIDKIKKI